jgi:uncharacterized Zn finger protein
MNEDKKIDCSICNKKSTTSMKDLNIIKTQGKIKTYKCPSCGSIWENRPLNYFNKDSQKLETYYNMMFIVIYNAKTKKHVKEWSR